MLQRSGATEKRRETVAAVMMRYSFVRIAGRRLFLLLRMYFTGTFQLSRASKFLSVHYGRRQERRHQ